MLSFQLKLENLPVEWVANQANKPPKIPSFKFTLNNNSSCVTPSQIALVFAYQYFIFDAKQLSAKQASAIFKFSFLVPPFLPHGLTFNELIAPTRWMANDEWGSWGDRPKYCAPKIGLHRNN